MQRKLLVIVGPTATGKTNLALKISKKFNGEIVSADSRQVYIGLDIGAGKDINRNSVKIISNEFPKYKNYTPVNYLISDVKVWGYDFSDPKQDFNVSDYLACASIIVEDIWRRGKLPTIVGGSGFYVKALLDGIESINIPPNSKLRGKLKKLNVDELFDILKKLDLKKVENLNNSDRKNPYRLIRAIEIVEYKKNGLELKRSTNINKKGLNFDNLLVIGLSADKSYLFSKVKDRVEKRLKSGFEKEVQNLIKKGVDWRFRSMHGLGYLQYKDFFEEKVNKNKFIENWIHEEQKYVKRQLTWFKKDKRIKWFDIDNPNLIEGVEKEVQNWYHEDEQK